MSRIESPPPTPRRENSRQLSPAPTPQPRKHEGRFGKFAWVRKIEDKLEALTVRVSPKKKKGPALTADTELTTTTTTTTTTVTTAQHDLAASEPAVRTGEKEKPSKEIVAECLKMLLERLIDGDRDEVGICFDLLKRLARNHEFAAAALDAWIAEALENCAAEDLDRIDENARSLLPKDEPLANGIELAIARTLLAFQLADAVQKGEIAMVARTLGRVLDAVPRDKLAGLIAPMPPSEAHKTLDDLCELLKERERLEAAQILLALGMNDVKI